MKFFFALLALFATVSVAFVPPRTTAGFVKVQTPPVLDASTSTFTDALDDFGLDEDSIPTDDTISPKRKCGFCLG